MSHRIKSSGDLLHLCQISVKSPIKLLLNLNKLFFMRRLKNHVISFQLHPYSERSLFSFNKCEALISLTRSHKKSDFCHERTSVAVARLVIGDKRLKS